MSKKHLINQRLLTECHDEIHEEVEIEFGHALKAREFGFIPEANEHLDNCQNLIASRIRYTIDNT